MMDYKKTFNVLEVLYDSCLEFWLGEGKDDLMAHLLAIKDVDLVTHNPFSPNGEELDPEAKAEFVRRYA